MNFGKEKNVLHFARFFFFLLFIAINFSARSLYPCKREFELSFQKDREREREKEESRLNTFLIILRARDTIGLKATRKWKEKKKNDKICSLVTTKRDRRERNVISESKYPISVTRLEIREPPLKWLPAFISVEPRNAISPRVYSFFLSRSPNLFPPVRLFPVPVSIYDLSKHGDRLLVVERICITRERPTSVRDNERCTRSNRVPFLPRCLFFFITFRSRLWNVGPLKNRAKFS